MWKTYEVEIELTEPLLGTIPKNPDIYKAWVESRTRKPEGDEGEPEVSEEKSWTGFYTDDKGLYILDYMIKGYLKEVASILPHTLGLVSRKTGELLAETTIKRRVDNWVSIEPRRIYLGKDEPDGVIERPLRARTIRGDRIALTRSDYVNAGLKLELKVSTLDRCPITEDVLREWFS